MRHLIRATIRSNRSTELAPGRPKDDSSIFQRSDGRWCGRLTQPDRTAKRYYGQTKRDVQVGLRAAVKNVDDGIPIVKNENLTVGQMLTQWLDLAVKPRVRASTFRGYESKVRAHILPALGSVRVSHLTPQRFQAFLNEKHRVGLSERTTGSPARHPAHCAE